MHTRLAWFGGALASLSMLLLALAPLPLARASVVEALDMPALVHLSREIVVGLTRSSRSRFSGEQIVTDHEVEVHERLRGGSESVLTVTTLGGAVGELGMRVEGAALLTVGERAVLFLRSRGQGSQLSPVGMAQGVLHVRRDLQGRDMVHPGGAGLALVQRVPGGQLMPAPAAMMGPRPLGDLCSELEALVAADGAP